MVNPRHIRFMMHVWPLKPLVAWTKVVWNKAFIPKHTFFVSISCLGKFPTQDCISMWKYNPPDLNFSLCNECRDTHDHLFFLCKFSSGLWQRVKNEVVLGDCPNGWSAIVDFLSADGGAGWNTLQMISFSATVYFIWRDRNRRLFNNKCRLPDMVFKEIKETVLLRLAWKNMIGSVLFRNGAP